MTLSLKLKILLRIPILKQILKLLLSLILLLDLGTLGFRRKKGESPYVCDMNVKFKKEKKQSTFLNPDPWARLVGSRNTAAIYIDGIATTALYDTGAELQLISKEFCEQNKLKIQPIEQLIECKGVVGTGLLEYDGYVEVNVQIPGRDFSEDHLFLVSSMMNSQRICL